MGNLQDVFYNWLSIKVVFEARPNDKAAKETLDHFDIVLKEEHQVDQIVRVEKKEEFYTIYYVQMGEEKKMRFPIEIINFMLEAIEREPEKYPIIDE